MTKISDASHSVPAERIRVARDAPLRRERGYVLYWMTAYRRAGWNFALQRARDLARELAKPLVVLEPLGAGHRWASDRFHRFILDGMRDNERRFAARGVSYLPYVESAPGAGRGLLAGLASRACAVVTDDYPCYFLPRLVAAAAARLDVRLEAIDSNGLLPMRAVDRVFLTARSFRRFRASRQDVFPEPDPLRTLPRRRAALPGLARWRFGTEIDLARLPIDHAVAPAASSGGTSAAEAALRAFLRRQSRYAEERNVPDLDAASGLSPWLHFGHLSAHQVVLAVRSPEFLDQLTTWRELGFNFCALRDDYDRYESLPAWARTTFAKHASDRREKLYGLSEFEEARTHDELWNAAQRQLVREGRIHNYLRMLWGKKILEWSATPQAALEVMIELNNKYALDGRDPNSYSGIFWCLGRYDRPWGPERPIFGTVRYMSSANTLRKTRARGYLRRYAP